MKKVLRESETIRQGPALSPQILASNLPSERVADIHANPTDRETLLLSAARLFPILAYTMFEAFGMMDDMESMHLLFQFFLAFLLLLNFLLLFAANCRLPMKSDVAE